jgi:chitinase
MGIRSRPLALALAGALVAGVLTPGTADAAALASGTAAGAESARPRHQTVGYFTQWGIYDRGFFVKDLVTSDSAKRLTVLNYAFANVGPDGRCFQANQAGQSDPWADYQRPFSAQESVDGKADVEGQALAGNFNQIRKLKKKYPHLRVQISLGGWTWSNYFSDAVLTERARRAFVASCVDLFIKGNLPVLEGDPHGGKGAAAGVFDGIDIDWEWPGSEGEEGNVVRAVDKKNLTLALAEFRRQLDAYGRRTHKHYSLTAFLPADPQQIDNGYQVRKVFDILDFATVQGYDMHGTWEDVTNHQSALFAPAGEPQQPDFTVDRAVTALLDRGAPRSKVVMGVPFYGRGWTGVPNVNKGLFQTAAGPAPGSAEEGYEDYRNLVKLRDQGFTVYRDRQAGFAWLFDGTTFWTYDDPAVLAQKARYIRNKGLGGAMVWSLDADDAHGTLLRTLDHGLR